jgi:hypothetical protein
MPQNGEINPTFGLYRNVCCGLEIIIREGVKFPDCRNHAKLPTIWKPIGVVDVEEVVVVKKKAEPAG